MIFLLTLAFIRIDVLVAVYTSHAEDNFSNAQTMCDNNGQDMLTISTWQEYNNSLIHFNMLKVSWLGLERTVTDEDWRWINNGKILTELTWASGQPGDQPCTYIDISNKVWYTESCTANHNFVCIKNSVDSIVGVDPVRFSTAMERCENEGGRLPVLVTRQDRLNFYTIISQYNSNINHTSVENVWLGLVAVDHYYKWITGKDLTPPFNWANLDHHERVHYHRAGEKDEGYHSDDKLVQGFVCQTRVSGVADTVLRSQNYYQRVITNQLILGDYLYSEKVTSHIQCAAVCSRNESCIRFIQSRSLCQTFREVSYTNITFKGFSFWEKTRILAHTHSGPSLLQ